jgi:hypothetical protein
MTRAFASAVAVAAAVACGAWAAASVPHLNSATSKKRHVVVTFALGELAPGRIMVARSPKRQPSGAFVKANVVVDEAMAPMKTKAGYRARTSHRLKKGRYWVEVSGRVIAVDCTPHKPCPTDWSNIRRVRVR